MGKLSLEDFNKRVDEDLDNIDAAFDGKYKEAIEGLLGLSKEEIGQITPDDLDLKTYEKLIAVVKAASAANIEQAELNQRIKGLGKVAVSIAKRVGSLIDVVT